MTQPLDPGTRTSAPARLWIILAAAVAAVILALVAAWALLGGGSGGPKPGGNTSATTTPPATPGPQGGGRMEAEKFAFTAPDGWRRSSQWGAGNDAQIIDAKENYITLSAFSADVGPEVRVKRLLEQMKLWVPGEIRDLATTDIGKISAPGAELRGDKGVFISRCVSYASRVYCLTSQAGRDDVDAVATAYNQVVRSWEWR